LHPEASVSIRYLHRNEEKTSKIVLRENPAMIVETFEAAGLPLTPEITQFRQGWLGGK
jgi:hypothetical protein